MTEVLLVSARLAHFAALMALFGSSIFASLIAPGWPIRRAVGGALAALALVSGLAWVACTLVGIAGLSTAFAPDTLRAFFLETTFGPPWLIHLGLCALLLAQPGLGRGQASLRTLPAAAALASLAWIGHASGAQGALLPLRLAIQVVHLLAAGGWLGTLGGLASVLRAASAVRVAMTLRRFSTFGIVAVVLILATGAANSAFQLSAPADLYETIYGRLLALKILLVMLMVSIAIINRTLLMPRFDRERGGRDTTAALMRTVGAEQGLGLLVLLTVSVLGTLAPMR